MGSKAHSVLPPAFSSSLPPGWLLGQAGVNGCSFSSRLLHEFGIFVSFFLSELIRQTLHLPSNVISNVISEPILGV